MSSSRQHSSDKDLLSIDQEALSLAKRVQKPGQTKEQTRLVSQGIAKGIELYKRQQSAKARERDKTRKKWLKSKTSTAEGPAGQVDAETKTQRPQWAGWLLIALGAGNLLGYWVPAEFQARLPAIVSGLAITAGLFTLFLPDRSA